MTHDPRLEYPPHYGLAGPSGPLPQGPTTTQQLLAAAVPPPAATPALRKVPIDTLDLGTYVYVWYSDGTSEAMPKSRFPSEGRQPDPDLGRQQEFEREQSEAARKFDWQKFVETMGKDKAAFNARQQLDEGALSGFFRGAPTLDRERLGETQRQFNLQFPENQRQFDVRTAIDYYTDLMNRAANPRNYMQTFFERRGITAPGAAAAFGNTAGERPWTIGTLEQFLPNFLGYAGARSSNFNAYASPGVGSITVSPASTSKVSAPVPQTVTAPAATSSPALVNIRPEQDANIPRNAVTVLAPIGPVNTQTNTQPGQTIGLSDSLVSAAKEAGMSPQDYFRKNLAPYARGGVIPEPVVGVGMVSGRPYTFGEEGPEGIVPADYLPDFLKRRGGRSRGPVRSYAIGGEIGFDSGYETEQLQDPYAGDIYLDLGVVTKPKSSGGFVDPASGYYIPDYNDPSSPMPSYGYVVGPYAGATTGGTYVPEATTSAMVNGQQYVAGPAGAFLSPEIQKAIDDEIARVAALNAAQQTTAAVPTVTAAPTTTVAPPSTTTTQPLTTQPAITPEQQAAIDAEIARTAELNRQAAVEAERRRLEEERRRLERGKTGAVTPIIEQGRTGTTTSPVVQQPTFLPQNGQTAAPQNPAAPTAREVSAPGTFGSLVGSSQTTNARPRFLSGEDTTPLQALAELDMIPPFITRALAQARGLHAFGTNQPIPLNLPPDVPLLSSLALRQMSPTERQGFASFLSSYGIDWNDYAQWVEDFSPSGPRTQLPTFGTGFSFRRQ